MSTDKGSREWFVPDLLVGVAFSVQIFFLVTMLPITIMALFWGYREWQRDSAVLDLASPEILARLLP